MLRTQRGTIHQLIRYTPRDASEYWYTDSRVHKQDVHAMDLQTDDREYISGDEITCSNDRIVQRRSLPLLVGSGCVAHTQLSTNVIPF